MLKLISILLPWKLRRLALKRWYGYNIHPKAKIGWAWVFPRHLTMSEGAKIDHFTVAIHLDEIQMQNNSRIGRSNWITGFPTGTSSPHFKHQKDRKAVLILRNSSAITKRHHLDCTDLIDVGAFATIAGYNSQFLTHSLDVIENRQDSAPIMIGAYTFVGTSVVILGGSILPAFSVLGAKSLLNKKYSQQWTIYGGVPATPIQEISKNAKYFNRFEGFVY